MPSGLDKFFYSFSPLVIAMAAFIAFWLAGEIGYRLGKIKRTASGDAPRGQITTLQAAILGFLALMLGFSFSISQSRFDTRRRLVIEEANAIETTFLRAQLLPPPFGEEISQLLADYAATRVPQADDAAIERAISQAGRLHQQIWARAVAVAKVEKNPAVTSVFVMSLNQMIDLHTTRVAAYLYRAPAILLLLLYFSAMLTIGVMGYAAGRDGRRDVGAMVVVILLISIVLLLIVDLEQSHRGMMRASQQSLINVRDKLANAVAGGAANETGR